MSDVLVSIACTAYNHEKYIADALDSFLMQKTDFEYEILVHDDASTDDTAEIIREYERRFPHIIKPIYQTENQYSKNPHIIANFLFPKAKGKYIAMCEGDDYWTDPLKLQMQVDYLECHPTCSLCVHAIERVKSDGRLNGSMEIAHGESADTTFENLVNNKVTWFQLSSWVFRTNLVKKLPDFYWNAHIGDTPLRYYLALCGYTHYIDRYMSVYRWLSESSWSRKVKSSETLLIENHKAHTRIYNEIDEFTNYKYTLAFRELIRKHEFCMILSLEDFGGIDIRSGPYKKYFDELSVWFMIGKWGQTHLPRLYRIWERLRDNIFTVKHKIKRIIQHDRK